MAPFIKLKSMSGYTISKKSMVKLLKNIIKDDYDANAIAGVIASSDRDFIEHLFEMIQGYSSSNPYKPFKIGDFAKIEIPRWKIGSEFELDTMEELGMISDNKMYARISKKNLNTEGEFNPYKEAIWVELLIHDGENKPSYSKATIKKLHELERVGRRTFNVPKDA